MAEDWRQKRRAEYLEKLKDPRWQKKRLEILERDKWTCQSCLDTETTLHVHHRYYKAKTEPWDQPNETLVTLCENCHELETLISKETDELILHTLKDKGFLSNDLVSIAAGFYRMNMQGQTPEFVATAIEWAFAQPRVMEGILKLFHEHLGKRAAGQGTDAPAPN